MAASPVWTPIHARRIQPHRRDLFDRQARAKPVATLRPRAGLELAAVHGDALAHADEAVSALVAVAAARTVVAHRQLDVAVAVANDDLGPLRPGVLERIREPLLDEPVSGEVDAGRKLSRGAFDPQLHREPSLARLLDQPLELLETGLRGERGRLLGPAEDADHAPHLRERLTARSLDHEQSLPLALLVGLQEPPDGGGLDGHHADAVADHVVELACDARPFLEHRQPRLFLSLTLGACRPLLRLVDLAELAANPESNRPGDREDDREEDIVSGLL